MRRLTAILRIAAVISSATLFTAFVSYRALSSSGNWRRMFSGADSPGLTPIVEGDGRTLLPGSKDFVGVVTLSGDLDIPSPKWAPVVKPAEAEALIGTPHPANPTLDTDIKPAEPKPIPPPDASGSGPKRELMPGTKKLPYVFSQSDVQRQATESTQSPRPSITTPIPATNTSSAVPTSPPNDQLEHWSRAMLPSSKEVIMIDMSMLIYRPRSVTEMIEEARKYLQEDDRKQRIKKRRLQEENSRGAAK